MANFVKITDENIRGFVKQYLEYLEYLENIGSDEDEDHPHIGEWDVSRVTNMSFMFENATIFNEDISDWDVSNVKNMSGMFFGATSFNQPIGNWNVSNVTDMSKMFENATSFDQPIGNWSVSNVTNMSLMFNGATSFDQPIGNWNVSKVNDMNAMFAESTSFNQDISGWNVSNVNNMRRMFQNARRFNEPIGNWNVSNVTNMSFMFFGATRFNQPIDNWNVSKVNDMNRMFANATSFKQVQPTPEHARRHNILSDKEKVLSNSIIKERKSDSESRKQKAASTIQKALSKKYHRKSIKESVRVINQDIKESMNKTKKAATTIQNLYRKSRYTSKRTEKQNRQKAESKLKRFFKKNMSTIKHKIRTNFLKSICSDSGVCIAFGKEEDKINEFFNGFIDFKYATAIRRIGGDSANGFVYEIKYERDNYIAHAVLKSSISEDSDNLSYEYFVGEIINKDFIKRFPCFVKTYGRYGYKNTQLHENMKNGIKNKGSLSSTLIYLPNENIARDCENSKYMVLLIQNIKNAKTLGSMLSSSTTRSSSDVVSFIRDELINCLYQIYFVLSEVCDNFTHYDLHTNNVLLFEPVNGKYIHYHYTNKDGSTCSFKSRYIVKIIDYGMSYILDPETGIGSMTMYNKVCAEPKCVTTCGDHVGYALLDPAPNEYHVNSTQRNASKDLWLLNIINDVPYIHKIAPTLAKLTKKVNYGIYGIAENLVSGYPNTINNVNDAEICLREIIVDPNYDLYTKLVDLNIVSGSDMEYTLYEP